MLTRKQKIWHAVIFIVIILLGMGGINYYVDAYAQIRVTYKDIAGQMLSGYHVENLSESRCNERYLAVAVIDEMREAPETVMLGSSRSMIYGAEELQEDSFYNFSLSGGSLLDYYGIVGYLAKQEKLPRKVIVEIGGPLLYEAGTDSRYTYLQGGIDYLDGLVNGEEIACDAPMVGAQYQKLFAIDYLKYNVQCLLEPFRFDVSYTKIEENENSTKLSDGSLVYGAVDRERKVEYVHSLTQEIVASGSLYKVDGFAALSEDYVVRFEKLTEWLLEQGIEVEFFIPTYSEPIYQHILEHSDRYRGVPDTEAYIINYAREKSIDVYGSYSPAECGLMAEDLYDPYHIRRECGMKVFYLRTV